VNSRRVRGLAPLLAALTVATAACARPGNPTGGPEDRRPPVVESVEPEPFSTIEPGDRTLRVRYNERISERPERGTLEDVVVVSPRTGEVEVSHDRMGIDIEVEGGFREGLVYRVTIAPSLRDMFDNPMAVPFEWVFSTGDSIRANAVVGQVWDATTGDPVDDATVYLRRLPGADGATPSDTFPYVARTDSVGIFALRYLPAGPAEIVAWQDVDNDAEVDFAEARVEQRLSLGATDTVTLANLPILPADTTRAVLEDAEVLDSLTIRVEFDDLIDPLMPIDEIMVTLSPAADSTGAVLEAAEGATAPGVERLFHEAGFAEWADSLAAARDSAAAEAEEAAQAAAEEAAELAAADTLAADTVAADTIGAAPPTPDTVPPDSLPVDPAVADTVPGQVAPVDSIEAATGEAPARPSTPDEFALDEALELLPDGRTLPQPSFVIRLAEPLPRGVPFDLEVGRVINLSQLAGGGGTITIELEPPEPEDPPPDS